MYIAAMNTTTPEDALAKSTHLSPALVDEVQENPEAIQPLARGMAAVNLYNLFVNVQQSNSNKDRLEFQALLNKMTGLEKAAVRDAGAGPQFSVVINIPGSDKGVIVESTATTLPNDE